MDWFDDWALTLAGGSSSSPKLEVFPGSTTL